MKKIREEGPCRKIRVLYGNMANKKNNNKITVTTKKFPKIYLDAGIANGGILFRQMPSLRMAVFDF